MTSVDTTAVPGVSGARVAVMRQILQERHPDALEKALATQPEDVRSEYAGTGGMQWVRPTTDYAVHDAVARELGQDAVVFHEALLREAMERSFKTLWKIFLRLTSDDALVARTPSIYGRTRNVGEMTSRLVGPGHAECVLRNYPGITARDARCLCVGLQVVLSLVGRKDAQVTVQKTDDGGVYTLRWKV